MARLGKRERAEKRARIARIKRVDYTYKIRCSHENFESSNHVARVCQAPLKTDKPMRVYTRHYRDLESGKLKQKSFG